MIDKTIPDHLFLIPLQSEMMPSINPTRQKPSPQIEPKNRYKPNTMPITGIHPSEKSKIGAKLKANAITGVI